jgi:steroid delta-isomerase
MAECNGVCAVHWLSAFMVLSDRVGMSAHERALNADGHRSTGDLTYALACQRGAPPAMPLARSLFGLAVIGIALSGLLPRATAEPSEASEQAIRAALEKWTADFNAGNAEAACGLFAPDLRYDFRGHSERDYADICSLLHHSLGDRTKKYSYRLEIKEILVSGELAVVRLVWRLRASSNGASAPSVESIEPGMDIFRRQTDGSWKIIRYIAYEE